MKNDDKKLGIILLVIGVSLVLLTPIIAIQLNIGSPFAVLFLRVTGTMIAAISGGVVLVYRKDSGKYGIPSWLSLLLFIILGGLFLANTTIRTITEMAKNEGVYKVIDQNYQK